MFTFPTESWGLVKAPEKARVSGDVELAEERGEPALTIGMLTAPFLEWARYERRLSRWTLIRYEESLRWVIRFIGDQAVATLHLGHLLTIRRKMEERGNKEARVAGVLHAFRSFLKFCNLVIRVPSLDHRYVRSPRIPKRDVVYLTPQEVQRFTDAIIGPDENWRRVRLGRLRFRAFVETLLGTGARLSEALALDRSTLDWERREARIIGKGNKERILFFTERSLLWVERYLSRRRDDAEPVFIIHRDPPRRLVRDWIKDAFEVYRTKAGIQKQLSAHILRHTMATTLLFNGCPIGHIKELLGHERLDTTCRYYLGLDRRAAKEAHGKFLVYE